MCHMGKRVIAILTAVVILLSSIVVPVSASQVVDYQVYAFSGHAGGGAQSIELPLNSTYAYGSSAFVGGYSILIPPSDVSGYIVVTGIYPIISSTSGSGWYSPSSYNSLTPYYHLSNGSFAFFQPNSKDGGEPFTGICYIPAHSQNVYLVVYGYNGTATNNGYFGARRVSGSRIFFVPDNDRAGDVVSGLQQVNQSIQNVYNEIHSSPEQDAESQQMLEELEKLSDQIEELSQQLDTVIERPPAEQVIPSIGEIIKPSDEAAETGMEALGSLFSSPLVVSLLVMAISFSIIRYVLYGKGDG